MVGLWFHSSSSKAPERFFHVLAGLWTEEISTHTIQCVTFGSKTVVSEVLNAMTLSTLKEDQCNFTEPCSTPILGGEWSDIHALIFLPSWWRFAWFLPALTFCMKLQQVRNDILNLFGNKANKVSGAFVLTIAFDLVLYNRSVSLGWVPKPPSPKKP